MPKEKIAVSRDGSELAVGWGEAGKGVQLIAHTMLPSPVEVAVGFNDVWSYFELDRAGINNLIRQLRRARDREFGKDE